MNIQRYVRAGFMVILAMAASGCDDGTETNTTAAELAVPTTPIVDAHVDESSPETNTSPSPASENSGTGAASALVDGDPAGFFSIEATSLASFAGSLYANGRWRRDGSHWIQFPLITDPAITIVGMEALNDELLFITQNHGILIYDSQQRAAISLGTGLEGEFIVDVDATSDRLVALTLYSGLFLHDRGDQRWKHVEGPEGYQVTFSRVLIRDGIAYIGTNEVADPGWPAEGLFEFDIQNATWRKIELADQRASLGTFPPIALTTQLQIDALAFADALYVVATEPRVQTSAHLYRLDGDGTVTEEQIPSQMKSTTMIIAFNNTIYAGTSSGGVLVRNPMNGWTLVRSLVAYNNITAMAVHEEELYVAANSIDENGHAIAGHHGLFVLRNGTLEQVDR